MTLLQIQTDLTEWFIEGTFIAALIFALVYIPFFDWRETVTGRATTILDLSIAGTLLHSVLIIWGVDTVSVRHPEAPSGFWSQLVDWLSIVSLGAAGLAICMLAWQAGRYVLAQSTNKIICRVFYLGRKLDKEKTASKRLIPGPLASC